MNTQIELDFIRQFIREEKRERLAQFASKAKTRDKMIRAINSPGIFDPKVLTPIEGNDRTFEKLMATYTKHGMGSSVYVISENCDWDGKEMELLEILKFSIAMCFDVIGYCHKSNTAFYEWHHSGASYFLRSITKR
jgi:hypothetical protein